MIATFTDFGGNGPYLGQVRAVLHQQAPGVAVVDLFPDLPAYNVQAAAYLLPAYSQYLPRGCVCLCVVDPGVGSDRAAVAVQADGRWYVGPDNGLLSQVVRRASSVTAFEITWRPEGLSASFHGRDLFAPVCAMLAGGGSVPGQPIDSQTLLWAADRFADSPVSRLAGGPLRGRVYRPLWQCRDRVPRATAFPPLLY